MPTTQEQLSAYAMDGLYADNGSQRAGQARLGRPAAWRGAAVFGDNAYASQKKLIGEQAPQAKDFTNQRTRKGGEIDEVERSRNRNKSRIRARVEHAFAVVKRLWDFSKVRYRGLGNYANRSFVMLGLANLYQARRKLAE